MRKRDFPVDDVRRFLEPGPIVLVSSAWKGKTNIMTHGVAHGDGRVAVARRLFHLGSESQLRNDPEEPGVRHQRPDGGPRTTVVGIGNTRARIDKFAGSG